MVIKRDYPTFPNFHTQIIPSFHRFYRNPRLHARVTAAMIYHLLEVTPETVARQLRLLRIPRAQLTQLTRSRQLIPGGQLKVMVEVYLVLHLALISTIIVRKEG